VCGPRGHDRMVVWFTTICRCEFEPRSPRGVLHKSICGIPHQ